MNPTRTKTFPQLYPTLLLSMRKSINNLVSKRENSNVYIPSVLKKKIKFFQKFVKKYTCSIQILDKKYQFWNNKVCL